jgi:predicted glycosyltransferase
VSARVFFYVQHLLGIGHLRRAALLARALSAGGFDVLLVSGGAPTKALALGGARFHQLPPLRATDTRLKVLAHPDGVPVDPAFRFARLKGLVRLLRAEAPDIVVTEQFPFGRTQLRFELLPLMEAALALRPRPLIVSSVRDVVRESATPQRIEEMLEAFDRYFDFVMIHADPDLVSFDRSFAAWDRICARAHYTGYVVEPGLLQPVTGDAGTGEVVISAGGGAVGGPLLRAALAARPLTSLAHHTWRLLVGANMPAEELEQLRRAATLSTPSPAGGGNRVGEVIIEPARPDFAVLLRNARISISQGGYNTLIETLCLADRAVIVPFAAGLETEQTRRAALLAERGMIQVVAEKALAPETLASAIERALAGPSIRSFPRCDVGGGPASVALLGRALASHRERLAS